MLRTQIPVIASVESANKGKIGIGHVRNLSEEDEIALALFHHVAVLNNVRRESGAREWQRMRRMKSDFLRSAR